MSPHTEEVLAFLLADIMYLHVYEVSIKSALTDCP